MKKFILFCTNTMAIFTTVFASDNATVRPTICPEFPHSFCIQNTECDTLTIEYVVVDCSGSNQTKVELYVNSLPYMKHHTGSLRSVIRHKETLFPNESRNLSFVFGDRFQKSAVTVSVMVIDQFGNRHFICCNNQAQ